MGYVILALIVVVATILASYWMFNHLAPAESCGVFLTALVLAVPMIAALANRVLFNTTEPNGTPGANWTFCVGALFVMLVIGLPGLVTGLFLLGRTRLGQGRAFLLAFAGCVVWGVELGLATEWLREANLPRPPAAVAVPVAADPKAVPPIPALDGTLGGNAVAGAVVTDAYLKARAWQYAKGGQNVATDATEGTPLTPRQNVLDVIPGLVPLLDSPPFSTGFWLLYLALFAGLGAGVGLVAGRFALADLAQA